MFYVKMFATQSVVLLILFTIGTDAQYKKPVVTVDSLLNFINGTAVVYQPVKNKKVPAILQTTEGEILQAGYPVETHQLYSEDGQMLTMHRIPGPSWGKSTPNYRSKQPVLILHGFLGSSQIWLALSPKPTLPYVLADEGFDVWMGNFRANYYSKGHLKYSTKDRRYWDFSFHEMGQYDIPAMIDYILLTTGFSQVVYIGHSMGTTSFLVMGSVRPEYNSKVKAAILLSPIALTIRTTELTPLLSHLFPHLDLLLQRLIKQGSYEFFPRNEYFYRLLYLTCGPSKVQPICFDLIAQAYGDDRENVNQKEFGKYAIALFAGTSVKTAHHLLQLFSTGEFRCYDYGAKENEYRYGSRVPPDYPLDRVTAPIYMYYGPNDVLMTTRSVHRLARTLPNVLQVNSVDYPKFSHLDFLYGNNAKKYLYDNLVALIKTVQRFDNKLNPFYL